MTARQRYELYRSIRDTNPSASREELRRLYRQAIRNSR